MRITKAKLKQMIKEELEDNTDEYMISSTIHIHLQNMYDSLSRSRIQLKQEEFVDFVQKALESFKLTTTTRMS